MSRSTGWLGRRRRGSSRTARVVRSHRGSPPGWTRSSLRPDGDSRLSDGVVVETHLLARLLGIRLLRVDGVVLLAPGRLEAPVPTWTAPAAVIGADLDEAARLIEVTDLRLRGSRDALSS